MRIERVELTPYALPFREPYVSASGTLEQRELVLMQLVCDDGTTGLGEAVPLSLRGGAPTQAILGDLRSLASLLQDVEVNATSMLELYTRCEQALQHDPSMAALDSALLDLFGKLESAPVWSLLGAKHRHPIECNATLVAGQPHAVADDARRWADEGFASFKLKLGAGHDIETVASVRAAIGDQAKLRIDVNGAWDVAEATHKLSQLAQFELELVEQPVTTLEELAQVHERVDVPIAADESIVDPEDAIAAVREGACDMATVKLSKVGGSVDARSIASLLPTYLSSALDGPVGIAAAAHLAQALPEIGHAHGLATQRLYACWPARDGAVLSGSRLTVGERPGLGVDLDLQQIEQLRIDVE